MRDFVYGVQAASYRLAAFSALAAAQGGLRFEARTLLAMAVVATISWGWRKSR